jgi:SAM-dependent methyltransferase
MSYQVFEEYYKKYDEWFERNINAYNSELKAIRSLCKDPGRGLEIGVGSGRFAVPLGFEYGVEPSFKMCEIARKRGNFVIRALGEKLPFRDDVFDSVLIVTTICFMEELDKGLSEAGRVLRDRGILIAGIIDRESNIGQEYLKRREGSIFYKSACFYSVDEMVDKLRDAGFNDFSFSQTLFGTLGDLNDEHPVKKGYGEGSFVVIRASK